MDKKNIGQQSKSPDMKPVPEAQPPVLETQEFQKPVSDEFVSDSTIDVPVKESIIYDASASAGNVCSACGISNKDSAAYCHSCGIRL